MDYWSRTLTRTISRRRAMATVGGGAAAAALLAACGGGSKDSASSGGNAADNVAKPAVTTKNAVRGGVIRGVKTSDALNFDPLSGGSSQIFDHSAHVYSRFLQFKTGTFDSPPTGDVSADAATSWELSSDGMQLTMKLRPSMKFDPRPPTNGHDLTTDDVKYSVNRAHDVSTSRGDLFNDVAPSAPISSVTYPDAKTVVMKLAFPMSPILAMMAYFWYLPILPKEADGGFDSRQDMRGSGMWMMTSYERSVGWSYRRNPNYYDAANRPFLDGVDYSLISETVQTDAQFKNKALAWYGGVGAGGSLASPVPDSVLSIRKEAPQANMFSDNALNSLGNTSVALGFSGRDNSIFRDERVRQAVSLLIDRDTFIDTFYNVPQLQSLGYDVRSAWNTHLAASWGSKYWTDPQARAKDLGDGAQYFQHDPKKAMDLLKAAGRVGAEEFFTYHSDRGGFGGPTYAKEMEVISNWLVEGGHFKLKVNVQPYQSVITTQYTFSKTDFDGIAGMPVATYPDIDLQMFASFTPSGRNAWVLKPLPVVDDLMQQHRKEMDSEKRFSILHRIESELAKQMPWISRPGLAEGFVFSWPWLQNYQAVRGWNSGSASNQEVIGDWWLDPTKQS